MLKGILSNSYLAVYVVAIITAVSSVLIHKPVITDAMSACINESIDHENLNP